jgi:hypothetical protein
MDGFLFKIDQLEDACAMFVTHGWERYAVCFWCARRLFRDDFAPANTGVMVCFTCLGAASRAALAKW